MNMQRRWTGMLALLLVAAMAACGAEGESNESDDGEAEQTAQRQTSSSPPAAPATATVVAGTSVSLTLNEELSTQHNQKGDSFTATVREPVVEGNRVLIPEGATVRGSITAIQKEEGDRPPAMSLDFTSIDVRGGSSPLAATLTSTDTETDKEMKGEGKKIGGGAAAGGLVGGLLGKDAKGALIGAAVGSAAGTVITMVTREGHAVLPAGAAMQIKVDENVEVRI